MFTAGCTKTCNGTRLAGIAAEVPRFSANFASMEAP